MSKPEAAQSLLGQGGIPNVAVVSGGKIAAFRLETEADAQTIASYQTAQQLPVYLVKQKLSIQLDGQMLAEYGAQSMGADQFWTYSLSMPGRGEIEEDFKLVLTVGDQVVFGVNGGGLAVEQVAERYRTVNPNASLENLHHVALGYWTRADLSDSMLARVMQTAAYRLPSVGLFAQPLTVQYWWGLPRIGRYKSYRVDIRRLATMATEMNGTTAKNFMLQSGMTNSHLEGRIFEEIFDDGPGVGASASVAIAHADALGYRVWRVDKSNLSNFLAASTITSEIDQEISNAVNAGLIVTAPEVEVDTDFWHGHGYIATDPTTGQVPTSFTMRMAGNSRIAWNLRSHSPSRYRIKSQRIW